MSNFRPTTDQYVSGNFYAIGDETPDGVVIKVDRSGEGDKKYEICKEKVAGTAGCLNCERTNCPVRELVFRA